MPPSRRCCDPAALPVSSSQTRCTTIPRVAEQLELHGRRGAVEHAHETALHVRRPAADDPPVRPPRTELRGVLRRDDVEVPVEVDGARPRACATEDDAGLLEARDGLELDHLGGEAEPPHRLAQDRSASPEPSAGRVLRVDRDELPDERGHLVGTRLEPSPDAGFAARRPRRPA